MRCTCQVLDYPLYSQKKCQCTWYANVASDRWIRSLCRWTQAQLGSHIPHTFFLYPRYVCEYIVYHSILIVICCYFLWYIYLRSYFPNLPESERRNARLHREQRETDRHRQTDRLGVAGRIVRGVSEPSSRVLQAVSMYLTHSTIRGYYSDIF